MASRIHFEERTGWAVWVHLAISVTFVAAAIPLLELIQGKMWGQGDAMSIGTVMLCLGLGLGIPGAIYLFMGQLRVRVLDEGIEVAWGILEVIRKTIPFSEVQQANAVTYSPLSEFGGWGIRVGRGKKFAWTIRGNRALCLHLRDGRLFYLGSPRPEPLLGWVQSVGKGKMGESAKDAEESKTEST